MFRVVRRWRAVLAAAAIFAVIFYFWSQTDFWEKSDPASLTMTSQTPSQPVTISVVCCGNERLPETLTMLKSAVLMSRSPLRAIILAENDLHPAFDEKLSEWRSTVAGDKRLNYEIHELQFPKEHDAEWRRLFKPCAAQRLFLPDVLPTVDAVLYVDTDTIFTDDPRRTWDHFYAMNSSQLAALSPEHHDPNVGWYNRFAKHPFYPPLGVNSGVMLMNLTRMREVGWTAKMGPLYQQYKLKITWGDQDLINIVFAGWPERLLVMGCQHNLRPDACMWGGRCLGAEKGAAVVHGSRGFFHRPDKQPAFAALYDQFRQFQLGVPDGDMMRDLYLPLESAILAAAANSSCARTAIKSFLPPIKQRASQLLNNTALLM